MYIDDPIGRALNLSTSDLKDYTLQELLELHPPILKSNYRSTPGNFREGYVTPEETKQKLREAMLRREQDPEWIAGKARRGAMITKIQTGRPSNPVSNAKRSETLKEYFRNNPRVKKERPPLKRPHKRRVICNETGVTYDSIIECSRDVGLCVRTIQNWCKGKSSGQSHSGLTFSYSD